MRRHIETSFTFLSYLLLIVLIIFVFYKEKVNKKNCIFCYTNINKQENKFVIQKFIIFFFIYKLKKSYLSKQNKKKLEEKEKYGWQFIRFLNSSFLLLALLCDKLLWLCYVIFPFISSFFSSLFSFYFSFVEMVHKWL